METQKIEPAKRTKLTKTVAEAITGPSKGYALQWDRDIRGFGLRVTASGIKSWILQARIKGRERRITIGRFPGVTPEIARQRASDLIGEIARGGDPVATQKREQLASVTLKEALEDYIGTKDLRPSTIADMRRAFNETLSDWLNKRIVKITRQMVERRYLRRVSESPARANAAFRYLRAVLNLAKVRYRDTEERPILSDNPVAALSDAKLWRKVERC